MRHVIMIAAVLLAVAGCDATTPPTAAPPRSGAPSSAPGACVGDDVAIGAVRTADVLTAVAPVVRITARTGGPVDAPPAPVRRAVAEVVTPAPVPEAEVYEAFLASLDDVPPGPRPLGSGTHAIDAGQLTVDRPGRFVRFSGVQQAEALFTYTCGTQATRGTVRSWLIQIDGVLDCDDDKKDDKKKADREIHDEARELSCR